MLINEEPDWNIEDLTVRGESLDSLVKFLA